MDAARALHDCGIAWHVADRLAKETPSLADAWARYAAEHPRMPVGTAVNGIRSGRQPPSAPGQRTRPARPACPATAHDPELAARFSALEAAVVAALRSSAEWEMWFTGAHLHRAQPLQLAVGPARVGWVRIRFGALIEQAAGEPVILVGCAGADRR